MKYSCLLKTMFVLILSLCIVYKNYAVSRDSVKNYYEYKYAAERAIMDVDYCRAVKEYKKAYQYKTPNSSDLYNSFKCAYLSGDSAMAKAWQELGVLHGWNKKSFEATNYGESIKDDGLYKWINTNYDSLHQIALNSNMPKVAAVMDSVFAADQAARAWYTKTEKNIEVEKRKMIHVDSVDVVFLKKYITENGYPGFDEVGAFEECNIPSTVWFILLHTRYTSKMLNELCYKAVLEGKMPPGEYAFIIDTQTNTPIYHQAQQWDSRTNRPVVLLGIQKEIIDKLRAEIFLEPLDECRKKMEFQKDNSHPFFEFVPFMTLSES